MSNQDVIVMERRRGKVITDQRAKLLVFIHLFKQERDYSPSIREMQDALGAQTTSLVAYHISSLREFGMLDFVPRQSRTIHLTKDGKKYVESLMLVSRRKDDDPVKHWLNRIGWLVSGDSPW